jgi:hypothetical protein
MLFTSEKHKVYFKLWCTLLDHFSISTIRKFSSEKQYIKEEEITILNIFIFYLWGTSKYQLAADVIHNTFIKTDNIKNTYKSYAVSYYQGTPVIREVPEEYLVEELFSMRKEYYKKCFNEKLEKINNDLRWYDYHDLLKEGYDYIIADSKFSFEIFYNIYIDLIKDYRQMFEVSMSEYFEESFWEKIK